MGSRGPVPKRSDQRRRTNSPTAKKVPAKKAAAVKKATAKKTAATKATTPQLPPAFIPPKADPAWHAVAKKWYASLSESGQSQFYQPSDWAVAFLIGESMSRDLIPQFVGFTESGTMLKEKIPLKGASLAAYLKAFSVLLVTEGDRRRLQIELVDPEEPANPDSERALATVTDLQSRLGAS